MKLKCKLQIADGNVDLALAEYSKQVFYLFDWNITHEKRKLYTNSSCQYQFHKMLVSRKLKFGFALCQMNFNFVSNACSIRLKPNLRYDLLPAI